MKNLINFGLFFPLALLIGCGNASFTKINGSEVVENGIVESGTNVRDVAIHIIMPKESNYKYISEEAGGEPCPAGNYTHSFEEVIAATRNVISLGDVFDVQYDSANGECEIVWIVAGEIGKSYNVHLVASFGLHEFIGNENFTVQTDTTTIALELNEVATIIENIDKGTLQFDEISYPSEDYGKGGYYGQNINIDVTQVNDAPIISNAQIGVDQYGCDVAANLCSARFELSFDFALMNNSVSLSSIYIELKVGGSTALSISYRGANEIGLLLVESNFTESYYIETSDGLFFNKTTPFSIIITLNDSNHAKLVHTINF